MLQKFFYGLRGDTECFTFAFRDMCPDFATNRTDLSFQVADARFTRIAPDDFL